MSSRHRNRILPPASLLISYLAPASSATFTNNFSAYPASARSCLDKAAAASGCTGNTVSEMNHCLCGNGGNFVLSAASCVSKTDHDELDDVYEMLLTSCTDSKTPLGVSQAEFLNVGDSKTSAASSSSTTFTTAATSSRASATSHTPLTTYKSVANGVTVTVTRGIASVPTGTNVGKGSSSSSSDTGGSNSGHGLGHTALAAGLVGGVALVLALLAFLCYRRGKQRQQRAIEAGPGGKFAALSSATSLTTMSSPPQGAAATAGAAATTQCHNVNDQRPETAGGSMPMAATPGWNPQHQPSQRHQQHQQGNLSPPCWQQQNSQPSGSWPSPVSNGATGTWGHGVSPVSQCPPGSSHGWPSMQDGTWNGHSSTARDLTWDGQASAHNGTWNSQTSTPNGTWSAQAVPVPAPVPFPAGTATSPVFELPGDHIQAAEADSTPIGLAQPAPAQHQQPYHQHYQPLLRPSSSIQSTPQMHIAHPVQPAPAHHNMPRQVDDALQISRIELPPPRYEGPRSPEWVSEDKKFG